MSVPALRFKDETGQDFPDWKVKPISELAIKVIDGDRGQNYPNGNDFSDDGYCLFLNAKNVTKSGFAFEELSFITKEKDEQLRKGKLSKNDLIITTRGSVGNIAHFDNEVKYVNMRINSGMVILRNESTDISPYYLYQYFYSPKFTKSVQQIAFGSAQPQLTVLEIKKFIVGLPLIKEQTKIANFLTAVDEKITQITQKHDLLTQYKKGVMQQIFSQELRFKDDDGGDFPEWEDATLGKVGKFKSGTGFPDSEQGGSSGIPFYKVSDMNLAENKLEMLVANNYVTEDQIKKMKSKVIAEEAIVFAKVGAAIFLERKRKAQNFLIDNNMMAFIPNCQIDFIKHFMDSIRLSKFAQVGALPSYNSSDLAIIEIAVPSAKEQTKIANFLTAIDDKITATQTQLQAVKQYKQGLLQQMFV